jgi:hypothetical protein
MEDKIYLKPIIRFGLNPSATPEQISQRLSWLNSTINLCSLPRLPRPDQNYLNTYTQKIISVPERDYSTVRDSLQDEEHRWSLETRPNEYASGGDSWAFIQRKYRHPGYILWILDGDLQHFHRNGCLVGIDHEYDLDNPFCVRAAIGHIMQIAEAHPNLLAWTIKKYDTRSGARQGSYPAFPECGTGFVQPQGCMFLRYEANAKFPKGWNYLEDTYALMSVARQHNGAQSIGHISPVTVTFHNSQNSGREWEQRRKQLSKAFPEYKSWIPVKRETID